MTRPTIIMVAPNGARKVKTDHSAVPVTIDETIATAKECHAAGASILHAHVRDDAGKHLLDVARYSKLLDGLRQEVPDMLVQITTEAVGIYTPDQQADLVFELKPDFVSVGFREMIGDNGEAARALAKISITQVWPSRSVFSISFMILMTWFDSVRRWPTVFCQMHARTCFWYWAGIVEISSLILPK